MRNAARIGDKTIGICVMHYPPHVVKGTVVTGSGNVKTENMSQSKVYDRVQASCGSVGFIVSGSSKVMVNYMPAARRTDRFAGAYSGIIISGAKRTLIGG